MDAKIIRDKLIGNDDQRAVSPVIGVILMVAITVILAAVIAAFVLDLGQSQSANPAAGISVDESTETATLTTIDRGDEGSFKVADGSECADSESFSGVGDTIDVSDCDSDETLIIIGEYQGSEAVVTEYTFE